MIIGVDMIIIFSVFGVLLVTKTTIEVSSQVSKTFLLGSFLL